MFEDLIKAVSGAGKKIDRWSGPIRGGVAEQARARGNARQAQGFFEDPASPSGWSFQSGLGNTARGVDRPSPYERVITRRGQRSAGFAPEAYDSSPEVARARFAFRPTGQASGPVGTHKRVTDHPMAGVVHGPRAVGDFEPRDTGSPSGLIDSIRGGLNKLADLDLVPLQSTDETAASIARMEANPWYRSLYQEPIYMGDELLAMGGWGTPARLGSAISRLSRPAAPIITPVPKPQLLLEQTSRGSKSARHGAKIARVKKKASGGK